MTGPRRTALFAVAVLLAAAVSAPASTVGGAGDLSPGIPELLQKLAAAPRDPLAPFQLSLDITARQLREVLQLQSRGRLKAETDLYERFGVPGEPGHLLHAPDGLSVLDIEFFLAKDRLIEASLELRAALGPEHALAILDRELGRPEFEVVLPGAIDVIVGWHVGRGLVLATFNDLDLFRLSVFRDDAEDLLAGSQIVLFEGLHSYSRRLAAGVSAEELERDLTALVDWVAVARAKIEPVR